MTAKEYLNRGYLLLKSIDAKKGQIDQLRTLAEHVTASYGGEVVSHSRNVHSLEEAMAKIVDAQNDLGNLICEYLDVVKELRQTIDLVADPECQLLLEMRYISMKSWKTIGVLLECCRTQTYNLHKRGLALVETVLRTREECNNAATA